MVEREAHRPRIERAHDARIALELRAIAPDFLVEERAGIAALVLAFPAIVLSTSDRAFGYLTLYRSMVGVMTWLGLCAVLGVVNGVTRAAWLARRG